MSSFVAWSISKISPLCHAHQSIGSPVYGSLNALWTQHGIQFGLDAICFYQLQVLMIVIEVESDTTGVEMVKNVSGSHFVSKGEI